MSRRVLKMSGQTDRERATDLMAGGANAFKDYMFFSDEQDRSSFPTDNLAAQCAFVIGVALRLLCQRRRATTATTTTTRSTEEAAAAAASSGCQGKISNHLLYRRSYT